MSSLSSSTLPDAVARARRNSSFLAMLLDREPEIEAAALAGELLPPPVVAEDLPVGTRLRRERRALALSYGRSGEAMLVAVVQPVEERLPDPADDAAFLALDREVRRRAEELGRRRGIPQDALNQLLEGVEDPGAFADIVAFYLEMPAAEKQAVEGGNGDEEAF